MPRERRLLGLVLAVAVVAAPAVAMRVLCVGRACDRPAQAAAEVPFCSLPPEVREPLGAGYRDGRSPDVLAVTGVPVRGGPEDLAAPWPAVDADARVPLVFSGAGVDPRAPVPDGARLDAVAPTVADIIELDRPHPEVRSGEALPGVAAGDAPSLVLLVAWKGAGTADLEARPEAWPELRSLLRRGTGTLTADPGSLPLDPAAVLTTVGSGGLPRQHGITGTLVRDERGRVVRAWSRAAPYAVIAALGDDVDRVLGSRARVGLVATALSDRGLVGGTWYPDGRPADVVIERRRGAAQAEAAERLLAEGYGEDGPDLLAVVLDDRIPRMDAALGRLVEAARSATGGAVAVVVTSTGAAGAEGLAAAELLASLEERLGIRGSLAEAVAVGGLFLDPERLTELDVTEDRVVAALRDLRGPGGEPVVADAFPGLAVTLARFC